MSGGGEEVEPISGAWPGDRWRAEEISRRKALYAN